MGARVLTARGEPRRPGARDGGRAAREDGSDRAPPRRAPRRRVAPVSLTAVHGVSPRLGDAGGRAPVAGPGRARGAGPSARGHKLAPPPPVAVGGHPVPATTLTGRGVGRRDGAGTRGAVTGPCGPEGGAGGRAKTRSIRGAATLVGESGVAARQPARLRRGPSHRYHTSEGREWRRLLPRGGCRQSPVRSGSVVLRAGRDHQGWPSATHGKWCGYAPRLQGKHCC